METGDNDCESTKVVGLRDPAVGWRAIPIKRLDLSISLDSKVMDQEVSMEGLEDS